MRTCASASSRTSTATCLRSKRSSPTWNVTRSTSVVCLGDICFGPQAHECLARVRELGCPVILGNWDSWSIDGFPPADDPVGIMLYEIGRWWADKLTDDDEAFVRTFVPTLDLPLDDGSKALCFHGSPRSFSDWIFATTPDDDVGKMFDGELALGAHRRPHAPADAAPLRPVGDRQPGQRRPAVQPVVAEGDPRRPLGRVRRDRQRRRPRARSTCSACRTTSTAC